MPVLKEIQAPNGVIVTYHILSNGSIDVQLGTIRLHVRSYPNEEACLQGKPHACAFSELSFPISAIALSEEGLVAAFERALVGQEGATTPNLFYGGVLVADRSGTLQAAKDRAWSAIKAARAVAEQGNFTYDGGSYQADITRINGAVQLAVLAKANNVAHTETWTLTDNSTRQLDADQLIALGLALGQFISGVYAIGRALRVQINQAETIEAVNAIGWPA
ncbi:DUF4376 domain-containing protein [Pseudoduganella eburnea]|uniref:DUF4376 domain-containing protein n=1 Tax=Massilia eburnea TaxID=1776165 RepID=A0A6L6QGT6_9BURK|nr:DUF4376 domain-containing protein [Massilia eburnea]MTW11439.1 DUF4376 domain-containing protein [Massilia eburnea]